MFWVSDNDFRPTLYSELLVLFEGRSGVALFGGLCYESILNSSLCQCSRKVNCGCVIYPEYRFCMYIYIHVNH